MPDHAAWPPLLRLIEQVARVTGYAAAAWAGWMVIQSPLGTLALVAGLLGMVAAAGRWWHAELVATAILPWPFIGLAILAADGGTVALCLFVAATAVRRLAELYLFSQQVRRAKRRRVERWQQVASTLNEEGL